MFRFVQILEYLIFDSALIFVGIERMKGDISRLKGDITCLKQGYEQTLLSSLFKITYFRN